MLGKVPSGQEVRRSGANPGDGIYVTGSLGAAARGLELLGKGDVEHPAAARQLCPRPRHRVGQRVRGNATAMIDVSDGLSTDLGHILEAGQVSARVYADLVPHSEDVPLDLALHGGEDYELIITGTRFPAEVCGIPLTRIGEILASEARGRAWIVSASGEQPLHGKGWQHFD
jgi:thiamine-monophosphate kinase